MDPKLFGQRLRLAREDVGLSQEELANLVSKDQRAISEYERGIRKLAATDLPRFADTLNVSILYFFEDELIPNDLDQVMLAEFHQLTSRAKQGAIEILRILDRVTGNN